MPNSNGESWCQGLDGLAQRTAEYYKAGARFAKWRSVVSIPSGPTEMAVRDCAYGLARYAAIAQVCRAASVFLWDGHSQGSLSCVRSLAAFWLT